MVRILTSSFQHALRIALLTFVISLVISFFTQFALAFWVSLIILLVVVLVGIGFDIIGTAITVATEAPFHAMGADKINGSKQAIYLIRHASQVANFCNDVIGDISGTISGALIVSLILEFVKKQSFVPEDLISSAGIALVAAITVGGKALGKKYAIENANHIVFRVGKLIALFVKIEPNSKKSKQKHKPHARKVRK